MQKRDVEGSQFSAESRRLPRGKRCQSLTRKRPPRKRKDGCVEARLSNPHDFRVETHFWPLSSILSLTCLTTWDLHLLGRVHLPDSLRPAAGLADLSKICPE